MPSISTIMVLLKLKQKYCLTLCYLCNCSPVSVSITLKNAVTWNCNLTIGYRIVNCYTNNRRSLLNRVGCVVTWVKIFFTWIIIFTWVAWVKTFFRGSIFFTRFKIFCVSQNFLWDLNFGVRLFLGSGSKESSIDVFTSIFCIFFSSTLCPSKKAGSKSKLQ